MNTDRDNKPTGEELREALRDINYRVYSDNDLKINIIAKKKLDSAITELIELRGIMKPFDGYTVVSIGFEGTEGVIRLREAIGGGE